MGKKRRTFQKPKNSSGRSLEGKVELTEHRAKTRQENKGDAEETEEPQGMTICGTAVEEKEGVLRAKRK